MRKMAFHIMEAVIGSSIACIIGIALLVGHINMISSQYENDIRKTITNQKTMTNIGEDIYHIESLVWQHIISQSPTEQDGYEKRIDDLMDQLQVLLVSLEDNLEEGSEAELLHLINKQYVGFCSNVDVVLELSRDDSKKSAGYYAELKLSPYFEKINSTLDQISVSMDERTGLAEGRMEESIRVARTTAEICMAVIVFILVICTIFVTRHGFELVNKREMEQRVHEQRVNDMQFNVILAMANLIESRDMNTGEHVKRTSRFVNMISKQLYADNIYRDEIDESFLSNIWKAAPLHDIGKIKVPDAILQKPGKLTREEFEIMKCHTTEGGRIIYETMDGIEEREYVELAHDVAKYHHEWWDGTGYPEGLSGQDIPLCARIMAVADVFDALISERCYKKKMSVDAAYRIIQESVGTHFDPEVAGAFIRLRPQVEEYLKELEKKKENLLEC